MKSATANILMIFSTLAFGCFSPVASADKWALPQKQKFCSANKSFCFEVVPRNLESQLKYFEDKSTGRKNAGSPDGVSAAPCRGTLHRIQSDGKRMAVWSSPLTNDVAPVDAIVADAGDYVITFDNWHSLGYGDNVLVIYDSGGKLVRKYSLEDLLGIDVKRVLKTVSSRWWEGDKPERKIDEAEKILFVRAVMRLRFFDVKNNDDRLLLTQKAQPESRQIRIDLQTGQILP
jgi:hypothetical protein